MCQGGPGVATPTAGIRLTHRGNQEGVEPSEPIAARASRRAVCPRMSPGEADPGERDEQRAGGPVYLCRTHRCSRRQRGRIRRPHSVPEQTEVLTVEYKINLMASATGDYLEAVGTAGPE
jgi:hypothetical protein